MTLNNISSHTSRQSSSIRTGKASKPDYSVKLSGLGAKSVGKQAVKDDLRIEKHQSPIVQNVLIYSKIYGITGAATALAA